MKYKCKCKTFEVAKTTIKVINNEIIKPETYCNDCGTYGDYVKEHNGYGGIQSRKGGTVSRRTDFIK